MGRIKKYPTIQHWIVEEREDKEMHIEVIMGSPRKKDGYNLCGELEKKLVTYGHTVSYIFLEAYKIESCKGCGLCFHKSEKICPCKDDLSHLEEKLMAADGLIFASPVYAYQVPSGLKCLIDRMAYHFHRQRLIDKPTLIVVTSDGGGQAAVEKYLKMTALGWGCHVTGSLKVIAPKYFSGRENKLFKNDAQYQSKIHRRIERLTENYHKVLLEKENRMPSYYQLLLFNGLRSKTFVSSADYDYWSEQGWIEGDYFTKVKLPLCRRVFTRIMRRIVDLFVKSSVRRPSKSL